MDPISTAIIAAICIGVISGTTKVAEQVVVDAYNTLKSIISKQFGGESKIVESINNLEAKPESTGRAVTLQEEVISSQANQNSLVIKAADELLQLIRDQPDGETHIQNAVGKYIAQADRGSFASVTVDKSSDKK